MIIDGKAIAQKIREDLKLKIQKLKSKPGLAVVIVGDNPASKIYVNMKHRYSEEVGMYSIKVELPKTISQKDLINEINKLNKNKKIHGILVQLPLPQHINETEILKSVDPNKDVDGFNPINTGLLVAGKPNFVPATPRGIIDLIKSTKHNIEGKNAVIIGRSNIVGKPVASLLLNANATVTICHSKTKDLKLHTKNADILVVAIGKSNTIKANMVKKGAIVIDVGINKVGDKLLGDVDFENVKKVASHITPVPGGVGPMTIASLLNSTYEAYLKSNNF